MHSVLTALNNKGFYPDDIILDGKIHRFKHDIKDKKKSAWYGGFIDGDFTYVTFGSWDSTEKHIYKNSEILTEKQKRKINENRKRIKEEQEVVRAEAAKVAKETLSKLGFDKNFPYLKTKKIIGDFNLKTCIDYLYIPIVDVRDRVTSYQKVGPDGKFKSFLKGGRISKCFHNIKGNDSTIYVCEGFATGASIHLATGARVVCAMSASNVPEVGKVILATNKEAEVVICADNDKAGIDFAQKLKGLCKIVFPTDVNDFNDVHCTQGLDKLKSYFEFSNDDEELKIYPLGYEDKRYYFRSTYSKEIIGINQFTKQDLFSLMPKEYWEVRYPTENGTVPLNKIMPELIDACIRSGRYSSQNVRGLGVWADDGRVVVNLGEELLVDGLKKSIFSFKSKYIYIQTCEKIKYNKNYLAATESKKIIDALKMFNFKNKNSYIFLGGAIVINLICGALNIRPHVWITGSTGSGKTVLIEYLSKLLGENIIYVNGLTSEAAVRQLMNFNSLGVLIEEFETNNRKNAENVESILELLRQSFQRSGSVIAKGSPTGAVKKYSVNFSAIVASIRVNITNEADKSRFTILELDSHNSNSEHWNKLSELIYNVDADYQTKLFSRCVHLTPVIVKNFYIIREILISHIRARLSDKYAMLIAGFISLIYDRVIEVEEAREFIKTIDFQEPEENEVESDEDECLSLILSKSVFVDDLRTTMSVLKMLDLITNSVFANENKTIFEKTLEDKLGLKVTTPKDGEVYLAVPAKNIELNKNVFIGSKWYGIHTQTLNRIKGARKNYPVRFSGKIVKSTLINVKTIFDAKEVKWRKQ